MQYVLSYLPDNTNLQASFCGHIKSFIYYLFAAWEAYLN